jgi:hypothetical protein
LVRRDEAHLSVVGHGIESVNLIKSGTEQCPRPLFLVISWMAERKEQ